MDAQLGRKIEDVFGPLVVHKRDALQAGLELMPRFVTEFLLAKARSSGAVSSLDDVRERIRRFWVDSDRKGAFLSEVMTKGEGRLIGLAEAEPRLERRDHVARITQIDGHTLEVDDALVREHPELLYGGLWGTCLLRYVTDGKKPKLRLEQFQPYQLTRPDMNAFREARARFSLDEWLALLVTSAGYRPEAFPTTRQKLLLLARLVPLAQTNVNLVEMGPRQTGKSYLLRNLSPRVFLLAGARATPASLLYDLRYKQVGVVGKKKVVVFDEIGATAFPDLSLVAALKDYMESGNVSRGQGAYVADCSLVFTGNLDLDHEGRLPARHYSHLFEEFPEQLCDPAIVDRVHAFLPGWEFPKISDEVLADGPGLLSDYFGEVIGEMRRDDSYRDAIRREVALEGVMQRDRVAVERVGAGLLKLLYPDRQLEEEGVRLALGVAAELRQRVHQQLVKMLPGEFRPKTIGFPGMPSFTPADFAADRTLEEQDVEANQRELVGKLTILTVSSRGGGDRGFIECVHVEGKQDELTVTGLHGKSLSHSVRAAYEALKFAGGGIGLAADRLRARRMVVHLVNIAQPKEGPSAGLAFALAMLSASTGRRLSASIAVTGELSVQGNVQEVGGIAEKLEAARRHGRRTVIIPAGNAGELARMPDLLGALDVRPVRTLQEAVEIAFAA